MKSRIGACITALTLLSALAVPATLAAQNALGLKETVLYTFTGGVDGAIPYFVRLIQDEGGNLYGTTWVGGDLSACVNGSATGCGVVFKVDPHGSDAVLYSFTDGADGGMPFGGLVRDPAGNLYGMASTGGDPNCLFPGSGGCGVAFKIDSTGNYNPFHTFEGADGNYPTAGLVLDGAGNLYGATYHGGDLSCNQGEGCGVVFKFDPEGNETILYAFTGGAAGSGPVGDLLRDSQGNLYGAAGGGTFNAGVVFRVDPNGNPTVLYSFTGGADGRYPNGALLRDSLGNLYGTANQGGNSNAGVVFKVDPNGNETVLYSFTGGTDGANPYGGLVRDSQGNFYGTTYAGGDQGSFCQGFCGVVFKLDTTGWETVLYAFTGQADGDNPAASLFRDNQGNLYGTTQYGGDLGSQQGWCGGAGCGVVFKLSACRTALCRDN